ncbi:MAG TPA: IclR family transcriptional regulator [Trueperaceae bacterium]|nr:IclR family transcriptional regulator [Trueperaceae bacterium]
MRDATVATLGETEVGRDRSPYIINSALRTLQVLHAFAMPPHKLGLADVVEKLGLERNQAYRSLKTLEAAGFLVPTDDARYEPGAAAAALATATMRFHNTAVIDVAGPLLDRLSEQTRETVHLIIRSGDRAVCVDRRESPQSVRLVSILGRSVPLHVGAVPKAILAWLPAREQDAVLAGLANQPVITDKSITDPQRLRAEIELIRQRGYSISDEDFDAHAKGVGAPIFGGEGAVVGGVSVGGPSFRVDDVTLNRFAGLVKEVAQEISTMLART